MNRIKLGSKVQLNERSHKWHTDNLFDYYLDDGKIQEEDFGEIVCFLGSKFNKEKLQGKVLNYGTQDDDFEDKRAFVNVEFKYKGFKVVVYCSEKDLKKL